MVVITSKWLLKDGCPEALYNELLTLAEKVKSAEKDTLMYMVHLDAPKALDKEANPIEPPPPPVPLNKQTSVTFFEAYKDEVAFSRHVKGPVFQTFLQAYSHYFEQNPNNPGWPITENGSYLQVCGFARTAIDS